MAPSSTNLNVRLTSPVVMLVGGPEHERARARRRRAAIRPSAAHNGTSPAPPAASPSRGRSLAPGGSLSRGPSPMGRIAEDGSSNPGTAPAFVPPTDRRGRSSSRRGESPLGGLRSDSLPRGRSASAGPTGGRGRVREPVTTGSGTAEEEAAADEPEPALLRGLLTLNLSKPTRIKEINIKLKGVARTDWPEGIGPRRLDVMEENVILNMSTSFFSAASAPMDRRAASVDPSGAGRLRDASLDPVAGRRAASMMPARDMSVGRSYLAHDSAIHSNGGMQETGQGSTLSRIASSAELNAMSEVEQLPLPAVIGREWGPSPAYEEVPSMPGSPAVAPVDGGSIEPLELARRNPSLHATSRLRAGEHSPAPSRSPLGPSRVASNDFVPLDRTATANSTESSASQSSSNRGGESDPPSGAISPLSRSESRPESLHERGRTSRLLAQQAHSSSEGPSTASTAPPSGATSPAPSIYGGGSRRTSLANGSALPSALRNASNGPPSASRSASRGARFSLAGLSEALRGKSVSRTRESSIDTANGTTDARGRRDHSPDTVRNAASDRGVSRGRKTALKSLRDALTGADHHEEGGSDEEGGDVPGTIAAHGWKEFRAGTYTYPISLTIPGSLPPTIQSDFGYVAYQLKSTVVRAGALTSNLTASTEVILVSAPGNEDTEDSESIVVDRFWEQQARYNVALSGKAFPIGGKIPITIRLTPMAKIKLYRITATLEQKTTYFALNRKLTRHETPKKFPLLRIDFKDPKEPLLPILSSDPNVINEHPLKDWFVNVGGSEGTETSSCLDPLGPWSLESFIPLPDCSTRVGFSTGHEKSNISVSHVIKVTLRVERGDDEFLDSKGKRKLWDVIIEAPVHILSCRCTTTVLPPYENGGHGPGSPSAHGSMNPTPFSQPPDCGAHGTSPPLPAHRQNVPLHLTPATPTPGARSASRERQAEPPVTTIEQTLLFERLVSGEVGTGGEIPPTYEQVQRGGDAEDERGRQATRVVQA